MHIQMILFLEHKDSVEEAIKDADIISLHVPANKESFHLFDKEMLRKVKKGACVVNAARGAVINTPDLIEAVNNGTFIWSPSILMKMKPTTSHSIGQIKQLKTKHC